MLLQKAFVVCLISLLHVSDDVSGQRFDKVNKLHTDILENYDSEVVPKTGRDPLTVNISLVLLSLRNFDEVEEVLHNNVLFKMSWLDERLAWNQSKYDNSIRTFLKQKNLWVPDITIGNTVNDFKQFGDPELYLKVESSGMIQWNVISSVDTICLVNTEYFPFDTQICPISVLPWVLPSTTLVLQNPEFSRKPMNDNGHWDLTSVATESSSRERSSLEFKLTLKRKPLYYVFTLLVPVMTVSVLTCFSFLLPRNSGEKISYSITVFLAYMVLMTFITDSLPKTSNKQPILVHYIGVMLMFALVSVIWSVVSAFVVEQFLGNATDDVSDISNDGSTTGTVDDICRRQFDELDEIVGVIAKPRNSSFNQAGVTRFCNNNDDIQDEINVINTSFRRIMKSMNGRYNGTAETGINEPKSKHEEGMDQGKSGAPSTSYINMARNESIWRRLCRRIGRYLDLAMFIVVSLTVMIITITLMNQLISNDSETN